MYWLERQIIAQVQQALTAVHLPPELWTQLLTALLVGLLTAIGLQILVTLLGIALGISASVRSVNEVAAVPETEDLVNPQSLQGKKSDESAPRLVELGIPVAINLVLFAACFLAVKFSQMHDLGQGAIAALTIWSVYWLILTWASTQTLNAIAQLAFGWATEGLRRLFSVVSTMLQPETPASLNETDILADIRHEVQVALNNALTASTSAAKVLQHPPDLSPVEGTLATYFAEANVKKLTPKRVQRKLQGLLQTIPNLSQASLPPLPSARLIEPLNARTDLSNRRKQRLLNRLEQTWAEFADELNSPNVPDPVALTTQSTSPDGTEPSFALQEMLSDGVKEAIARLQETLPNVLERSGLTIPDTVGLTSLVIAALLNRSNSEALRLSVSEQSESQLDSLLQEVKTGLAQLQEASLNQVEQMRDVALKPITTVQQTAEKQIKTLQSRTREQMIATRKTAVSAVWWLFAIVCTSAISAAIAGALATLSNY